MVRCFGTGWPAPPVFLPKSFTMSNPKNNVTLYKAHLNLHQDANFQHIAHDDAMVATVYKITQPNNKSYILKVCDRQEDYLREIYFLKYFANKLLVPQIIDLVEPDKDIHGAILMEYFSGDLIKAENLTAALAFEIGAILGKIHTHHSNNYGDLTQPQTLTNDACKNFNLKFQEGIAECQNHLPSTLLNKCCDFFESNINLLYKVDGPCIIHRDYRPANIIVKNTKIQGIIDWSSARASFSEDDFCPLEHGEWPGHNTFKKSFLSGYASIRKVPDYNAIMPLLRLNRAIAVVGFTVKHHTWGGVNAKQYQAERKFIDNFFKKGI